MGKSPLIIAHRGASEFLPDNTIASFDQAIIDKADMLELDVRKTADGKLVLFHDWYLPVSRQGRRESSVTRLVSHTSAEEIQVYCEQRGFDLAYMDEVLERYGGRIALNIELKAGGYERELLELIDEYKLLTDVLLSSFFPWVIKKIQNLNHNVKTGWIVGQEQIIYFNRLARTFARKLFGLIGADSAHLHYEIVTPAVLRYFHAHGVPVYAWTVNDPLQMKTQAQMGVDGIITNRPGRLYTILKGAPEEISQIAPAR
jgi:glycerophosphoryl diester phosphodiesterase